MIRTLISASVVAITAGSAMSQQVFFNDFNTGTPAEIGGFINNAGVQGFNGLGNLGNTFSGNFLYNDSTGNPAAATTLTMTNLPSHTSISIGFLLAIIDSWDSTNGAPSPDFFNVTVDSVSVFQATFAIQSGSANYNPPINGDIGNGLASRGFSGFNDRAYDMSLESSLQNIPHTASSVTISFFASGNGWQGGGDESWGIDNLNVGVIPAPTTLAGFALLGVCAGRRRRVR